MYSLTTRCINRYCWKRCIKFAVEILLIHSDSGKYWAVTAAAGSASAITTQPRYMSGFPGAAFGVARSAAVVYCLKRTQYHHRTSRPTNEFHTDTAAPLPPRSNSARVPYVLCRTSLVDRGGYHVWVGVAVKVSVYRVFHGPMW